MLLSIVIMSGIVSAINSFAVGANDVANSMASSVGSKALKLRAAILIAGLMEFLGCISMGGNVSSTLSSGLVKLELYENGGEKMYMVGFFSALIGSSSWLMIATYFGMPVSTTHTIVSAICTFGLFAHGFDGITYEKLTEIMISWVTSPIIAGFTGYLFYYVVYRYILSQPDSHMLALRYMPWLLGFSFLGVFQVLFLDVFIPVFEQDGKGRKWMFALIAMALAFVMSLLFKTILFIPMLKAAGFVTANEQFPQLIHLSTLSSNDVEPLLKKNNSKSSSKLAGLVSDESPGVLGDNVNNNASDLTRNDLAMLYFIPLQILSAAFMAFGHGANDIANSIAPFAAIYKVHRTEDLDTVENTPFWTIVYGAFFLVLGVILFGGRVMKTIGSDVVHLDPAKGFCIELATSWTVLAASYMGIPVSTTHAVVCALLGVSMVADRNSTDWSLVGKIVFGWIITIVMGFFFTMFSFVFIMGLDALFNYGINY